MNKDKNITHYSPSHFSTSSHGRIVSLKEHFFPPGENMQVARHPGSNSFSLTTTQVYRALHLLKWEELEGVSLGFKRNECHINCIGFGVCPGLKTLKKFSSAISQVPTHQTNVFLITALKAAISKLRSSLFALFLLKLQAEDWGPYYRLNYFI